MPFEDPRAPSGTGHKKIAVIGAGISGMGAAHMLGDQNAVTLFESEPQLGGHARTRMAGRNGDTPVDTGFIVFNYANYPHLTRLFNELDVPVVPSSMSFGASIGGGRLEYGLASLGALFAQRRNALDPRFLGMVRDVFRFNKRALRLAQDNPQMTVGTFLKLLGTGKWFRDYYLLPLSGAIWSTPTEKIMDFPAHAMIQFFENHALLHHTGQHQWYTVKGGSREYVSRLETSLIRNRVDIRLKTPVHSVRRIAAGAQIKVRGNEWETFDEVIFATHSDDTLWMLSDPSVHEKAVLGAIAYQPNDIVLHSDESVMPRRRQTWSSWVYTEGAEIGSERIDLTYWMNSLQPWLKNEQFFVTLNSRREINPDLVWDRVTLRHPVYDLAALAAQKQAAQMNGTNNTWFCGAWMKNGFHEDGLSSAFDVAQALQTAPDLLAAE
jgi:predicted NAD/FAD-binding protein